MNKKLCFVLAKNVCVQLVLAAIFIFTGCASTHSSMRLHVAVADVDSANPEIKFYRVTIDAKSSNKKATLQTGYYDADAVRQLFGEVKKKDVASASSPRSGGHSFVFDVTSGNWRPLEESELFTIIFGADAKSLAAEIDLTASSNETGEEMGRLLAAAAGGGAFVEAVAAEKISAEQRNKVQTLANSLKNTAKAENLKDDVTADALGKALVESAQRTLEALGSSTKLSTNNPALALDEAEAALKALTPKK